MSLFDFAWVGVLTILLCVASSYIPARYAAKIEPLKAIRSR